MKTAEVIRQDRKSPPKMFTNTIKSYGDTDVQKIVYILAHLISTRCKEIVIETNELEISRNISDQLGVADPRLGESNSWVLHSLVSHLGM